MNCGSNIFMALAVVWLTFLWLQQDIFCQAFHFKTDHKIGTNIPHYPGVNWCWKSGLIPNTGNTELSEWMIY